MDKQYHNKFQVVFLIDKSFEHTKDFFNNHRHDPYCKSKEKEGSLIDCPSSSKLIDSSCDCGEIEDIDLLKSRVWKSISLSALRILCYLFTKNDPGDSVRNQKSEADDEDWETNKRHHEEDVDHNKTAARDLKNQIEYLTGKQSSLQWGYKFFNSNKLPRKTEHHQLKDFKLRYFEEFEKDLEKQFEHLDDDSVNLKPKPSLSTRKENPSTTGQRRTSSGPTSAECLKRTLSHVLYDFNWENPDITSPVISRKCSFSKQRKRSSNSDGYDCSGFSSGRPHNLVFLFQSCPSTRLELRHFAGKMVVDSEVFLDSFMPPSLFKEFVVNRNISLYWVDHQIQDDILHMNLSNCENESFGIVNEALVKLSGTLIPLDSLTVAGSKHWSSIYYNTRWANHLFPNVNSPQQPSQFGHLFDKKSEADDDFPPLSDKSKVGSKNKRSKYQDDNGRGLLPVTSVLDHFLRGPLTATTALVKDGADAILKRPHFEATLAFDQNENQPEVCPLKLVPTNSANTQTLEHFFTRSHTSNSGKNVHIAMTENHKKSSNEPKANVEFVLTKDHPNNSLSAASSSSPQLSLAERSAALKFEVYSYLSSGDVCSTSDYTFFCSVSIPSKSKFNTDNQLTSQKSSPHLLNACAKFQSLILRLVEADQNLVLTVKLSGEATPFLAVLQPLTVSLGLIVFFPLGLSLDLEKHLFSKSSPNITKKGTNKFQENETEYLDYITHRYSKRLSHSKYIPKSVDIKKSDIPSEKKVSKWLNVFDSAILNKWSLPRVNNPEMSKMSLALCKNIAIEPASSNATRETNLFKQLKTFYRQADSPSQLVNKGKQQEEEQKKLSENASEESVCQNPTACGGEPKPRLLQKLLSFNLGPTRAEMILSKSMQVVEQQSKVDKDDSTGISHSSRLSAEREMQVAAVVKQLADNSALSNYIKEFYDSTITENLNSWNRIHHVVAVVHSYMKERGKSNSEDEAKTFLEETVYMSSCNLRQKYQKNASLSSKKQDKILEYQLQIILRMEMLTYMKLSSEDQQTNDEEPEENEESTVDIFVEEIVTMLRTLSFITNAAIVPVFLTDVLLKNYADTLTRPLAEIYNELMQPLPSILATSIDSPESSVQSFCPSTVSTSFLDETTRDGFPELAATQTKKVKTMQIVPGIGEGVKRQIVVGKKKALTKKQKGLTKDTKTKKTEENDDKERIRARRSLFISEKKNLERHRSFAVRDKEKSRSHRSQRYSHRRSVKSRLKSSSAEKHSKTMVAETPAHKQLPPHVMRKWHLLQNRLTEPMKQKNESPSSEIGWTPKRATLDTTVSVIEESPLKDGIPVKNLSENTKKTTVLIKRGFYGLNNEKSQSRNLTKYLELADRIAGRHDRYAQLTDLSIVSQRHETIQSPVKQPSTFALSQLMGSPSSNSPMVNNYSTVLKYTPDRKSPSFPFSTSPKLPNKSSERASFKQALFQTPEKTVSKSHALILQSPNVSSQSPSSSANGFSVSNKLAGFNSLPNESKCIFKTPTKEPVWIFKSPDRTPTFKKLSTTPVKSISPTLLSKSHRRESCVKRQLSGSYADNPLSANTKVRSLNSRRLHSTNSLLASPPLLSKSSSHSDAIVIKPTKYPKTSDNNSTQSSSENKSKKRILTQDDNNNTTNDFSAFPSDLHSSKKSLPPASLSEHSYKLNLPRTFGRHRLVLQSDETCESRDSVRPQESLSCTNQAENVSEPLTRQKRKRVNESVSDVTLLTNKRPRRSFNYAQGKSQHTKEDQGDAQFGEKSQIKNICTKRTRRSTAIYKD